MTRKPLYPLRDFSAGLNDKDDPALIADNALADVKNAVMGRGFISKRHGYVKQTTNMLASPIRNLFGYHPSSGPFRFFAVSGKSLYNDMNHSPGTMEATTSNDVIEDCEDTWNESVSPNVTVSLDTVAKKAGKASVKLDVATGAVAGEILATEAIPNVDITPYSQIVFWFKCSVTLPAGYIEILLDDTANCASPAYILPISTTYAAETWIQYGIDLVVGTTTNIKSIGIRMAQDLGAFSFWIDHVRLRNFSGGGLSSDTSDVQMVQYKDRSLADVILIADGTKLKMYDWTGVTEVPEYGPTTAEQTDPGLNDLTNLTKFKTLAIKKDRIFAAAHSSVKNRLSFCHHDPILGYAVYDYWPATHFFDLVSEYNDEIIHLKTFRDALISFNRHTVWALYGDGRTIDAYELHRINVPKGLIAKNSVAEVGDSIFYLADDHVYSLFSTDQNYVSSKIVSSGVESTLKSISLADKALAVATFYDNKYMLSFPSGTTLVFDTLLQAWMKYTNVKANSFVEEQGILYFANDSGYILRFDPALYNDDGAAIEFSMTTKRFDFDHPVQEKKLRRVWATFKQYEGKTSTFNLSAEIDSITVSLENFPNEALVPGEDVVQQEARKRNRGKYVQYTVSNNVLNEPLTLYSLVTEYKLKNP